MIFVFVPYYNEDPQEFKDSIKNQNVPFQLIQRNRKRDGIYWTRACNDFWKQVQNYRGVKDDDVICIMNNDISFGDGFIEEGSKVKQGEVYVCQGLTVDWSKKRFYEGDRIDCFPGRAFFITYKDFKDSGGFSKLLPHYAADYEFAIRVIRKGIKPVLMKNKVVHHSHPVIKGFTLLSASNPIVWTIFLLKVGRNRYFFLNLLKAWCWWK